MRHSGAEDFLIWMSGFYILKIKARYLVVFPVKIGNARLKFSVES